MNETTLAQIAGSILVVANKLKIPKSTTAPMIPTTAKRKKRLRSFEFKLKVLTVLSSMGLFVKYLLVIELLVANPGWRWHG